MNIVFNTVTLLLFIILVYYLSKNTNKRCDNIHYVPMYEYEIIYKTDEVIPEKNPDTITQHVTSKKGDIIADFETSYSDTIMNEL